MSAQAAGPAGDPGETGPGPGTTGVTATGAAAAEAYLRLLTEAELRRRPLISGPGPHRHRVWLAATTLASAEVVAPDMAWRIVAEPVPPASTAARLLDRAGDDLLCLESATPRASARLEGRVAQVLQDLIGSGALRADDPAVLRLAGLAWRLGLDLGPGPPVPAAALPPAWASLLEVGHVHDGPDAVAPFAADLPEIGGARFALAGLRSSARGATLHVMARGWEPQGHGWLTHGMGPAGDLVNLSLSWQARDSAGRWHLVKDMSWGSAAQAKGMIKMYLTPPLHPAATALEVIVTGPAHRVRATMPLGPAADGPSRTPLPQPPGGHPGPPSPTGPGR